MKKALIGYTGFVGSNLDKQTEFDEKYNSSNIGEIKGREFDFVVCAGAPAEKWKINQEPEADTANLTILKSHLLSAKIANLVLISTVDVFKDPNGANEDTPVETEGLHPYGLHRYELEEFAKANFNTTIIRLPGLFGDGIKKNVIFDLLTNNTPFLEQTHTDSAFQYYNLDNIWRDIQIALDAKYPLVHFATEPVTTEQVAKEAFGIDFVNRPADKQPVRYDFYSQYAEAYGSKGDYLYSADEVLRDLREFVKRWNQN